MKTLDMRFIRYLNLFERISKVRTKNCFEYNNMVLFVVPRSKVSKAIGPQARNVKEIAMIIKKKIKIVAFPETLEDAKEFISSIISPLTFKDIDINEEIIINAGRQSKAALIGRNKRRLDELSHITKQYFNKNLRIV